MSLRDRMDLHPGDIKWIKGKDKSADPSPVKNRVKDALKKKRKKP